MLVVTNNHRSIDIRLAFLVFCENRSYHALLTSEVSSVLRIVLLFLLLSTTINVRLWFTEIKWAFGDVIPQKR